MKAMFACFVLAIMLTGCASYQKPIPENYDGPLARIDDSFISNGSTNADLFYVDKINDKEVKNTLTKTFDASRGKGLQTTPKGYIRFVPAQKAVFTITGHTYYAAPILSIFGGGNDVSGDIAFTPKKDGSYIVKGMLGENYSAVWIEEKSTGAVVGRKIEVGGS